MTTLSYTMCGGVPALSNAQAGGAADTTSHLPASLAAMGVWGARHRERVSGLRQDADRRADERDVVGARGMGVRARLGDGGVPIAEGSQRRTILGL